MIYKKKSLTLSIFFILLIQVLLLINNNQKTSYRYFVWHVKEVSLGKLVTISFFSGLITSLFLGKTTNISVRTYQENQEYSKNTPEGDNSLEKEDDYESIEMPPERDLRDTQPTISVNYRVIKNNEENKRTSKNEEYDDDWNNKNLEW